MNRRSFLRSLIVTPVAVALAPLLPKPAPQLVFHPDAFVMVSDLFNPPPELGQMYRSGVLSDLSGNGHDWYLTG